ncbi:hypothetical protein EYC84_006164 [Monilinia fructicola]|uniref:Uncharacterized protein n=1 Tax=Monilinia fructicola TaxID=38448 RepID=A0A5M9K366_MONFR|nr:hypothetical protein EYC84_006164 [Monilinia fructicola]
MSFTITQQTRLDRSNSTSSDASTTDGWLILNGHSRSSSVSPATTPSATDSTYNPFLQLSPVTRGSAIAGTQKFTPTEDRRGQATIVFVESEG